MWSGGGASFDSHFEKYSITGSLDRRLGKRWTLGAAVGATIHGELDVRGAISTVMPGPLGALTASFRPLDEGDIAPFVLVTGSAAASVAWTRPPGGGASTTLSALDARVGLVAGKTFFHFVTPYVLARAFGGPVFWSTAGAAVTGTDAHHYQLGAGLSVRVGRFDFVAEGVALGELGIVAGGGVTF